MTMRSSSTLPAPQPGSDPSTPTAAPSSSTVSSLSPSSSLGLPAAQEEEERGDLIHFYNLVYIKQMRLYALRYCPGSPSAGVSLDRRGQWGATRTSNQYSRV